MEFQAVQFTVDKLISLIRTGRLALPDFQRDFVWNPGRVVELLDSVSRQWPIGSLLFLAGPQSFGLRSIADAPKEPSSSSTFVLDGQQRITALFHAVANVSDVCYYVDFKALVEESDDYIKWQKRTSFERAYPNVLTRARHRIALIADIWENDTFFEWIEYILEPYEQKTYISYRERYLGGLKAHVYKLMAIELDQDIAKGALARIFETLNRSGVRLNAFDLLVAILHPTGFKLRDRWEDAKNSFEILQEFDVDAVEVLKLAALLIRIEKGRLASRGVRQGDLLALDPGDIREYWSRSVELYANTLDFAKAELGVFCADAVPAWSLVLALAAWLNRPKFDIRGAKAWFWESCFLQTHAQAANTRVVSDFEHISAGSSHSLLMGRPLEEIYNIFDEPARRNGLALRGLACALVYLRAADLVTGSPMREGRGLTFWSFANKGLQRLRNEDPLRSVLVSTEASARVISRAHGDVASLGLDAHTLMERLRTQFVSGHLRGDEDLERLIDGLFRGRL